MLNDRNGYQDEYAEKDDETGWNSFYLHNYDAAIGRWLTTDSYEQYDSPHMGMGNNPINRFDSDGGWDSGGDNPPLTIETVKVTAYVGWRKFLNTFKGIDWNSQWSSFQDGIPVWGAARRSGILLEQGDYLGAAGYFGTGLAEAFTFGYGNQIGASIVNWTESAFSRKVASETGNLAAKTGGSWAKTSGILRDAVKGNYGLGSGTFDEAMQAGRSWVGEGFTISKDGSSWISSNGLRQFRPPSFKPRLNIERANFQWRNVNKGAWL